MTRLHEAVAKGDLETVASYILEGDVVNDVSQKVTIGGRKVSAVKSLYCNLSPLHLAAHHGYLNIAKLLIEHGAKVNIKDALNGEYGESPLDYAMNNKQVLVASYLASQGTKEDKENFQTWDNNRDIESELNRAIVQSNIMAINSLLFIEKRVGNSLGKKALRAATKTGNIEAVTLLLDYGVDINTREAPPEIWYGHKGHQTVLGIAAKSRDEKMVSLLLKRGATVDKITHLEPGFTNATPLSLLMLGSSVLSGKSCTNLYELLLSNGAKLTKVPASALLHFLNNGTVSELEVLYQYGLNPYWCINGKPLVDYCARSNPNIANALINKREIYLKLHNEQKKVKPSFWGSFFNEQSDCGSSMENFFGRVFDKKTSKVSDFPRQKL